MSAGLAVEDFDLASTLECGQVFHWRREGPGWLGVIGEQAIYVEQRDGKLHLPKGTEKLVRHYFALDHPLAEICATFPDDPAMRAAREFCRGMRIVRQPAWECIATFITSSMKQVAHIAQISQTLRRRYGKRVEWKGCELFTYPTPEALARLREEDLRACALGYRAKNLLGAARMIAEGQLDLAAVARLDDDEAAREELCRLPGVGEKVANCALLFGFERVRAFPIDVWIERALREIYFPRKRRVTAGRLRDFSTSYFGPYGGYAQQYLFHHSRKTWMGARRPGRGKS